VERAWRGEGEEMVEPECHDKGWCRAQGSGLPGGLLLKRDRTGWQAGGFTRRLLGGCGQAKGAQGANGPAAALGIAGSLSGDGAPWRMGGSAVGARAMLRNCLELRLLGFGANVRAPVYGRGGACWGRGKASGHFGSEVV
jgi:hypothetical protein